MPSPVSASSRALPPITRKAPQPYKIPLLSLRGSYEFIQDPLAFMEKYRAKLGDIYLTSSLHIRYYYISSPVLVQQILQENHRNYKKGEKLEELKLVLGEGLLTSEGEHWLRQRRLAQPAFHRQRLAHMTEEMNQAAERLLQRLDHQTANGPATIDTGREMMETTLEIVCQALFGVGLGDKVQVIEENFTLINQGLNQRIVRPFNLPLELPLPENVRLRRAARKLFGVVDNIVAERRYQPEREDLLGLLMAAVDADSGARMSNEQLRDEIMTLLLAGHETSANALTWTLWLLARHPMWQERLREELQPLSGLPLGFAEFGQLPLLRRVLDEGLRLYPPAWVFIRQALGPDVLDGCEVRRWDNLVVSPYLMHRHPDYWTNPEAFDPDRFTPERGEPFHKFAYLPFGAGPRLCIGLQFAQAEMVIVLARLLQRYRVRTALTTRGEVHPLITLKPLHGMELVFERVG